MERKPFLKQLRFILPIGLAILFISSPASPQEIYSVDLVPPSYIDATAPLALSGDEGFVTVPLPFKFTFYKVAYDTAYVSTNGYLSFTQGSSAHGNGTLPKATLPNGAIYAFWDDLVVDSAASVRTETLGTAPKRQFVIEWRNARFYADKTKRLDFEIVLHEKGAILLQYRNIINDPLVMGSSATVGLEDETGSSAVLFSYNTASIGADTASTAASTSSTEAGAFAIRFALLPKPIPVDVKPKHCPNHFDVDSHGVFHVAILGTPNFDVTTIDPKTVTMGGVAVLLKEQNPLTTKKKMRLVASKLRHQGWLLQDVGTPYQPFVGKIDAKQCNDLGPDGYMDLVLHFDTQAIADSLGDVEDKEPITLQLNGQLLDGTDIKGEDVVIIKDEKHRIWRRGHHKGWVYDRGHDRDRDKGHDGDCDKGHGK